MTYPHPTISHATENRSERQWVLYKWLRGGWSWINTYSDADSANHWLDHIDKAGPHSGLLLVERVTQVTTIDVAIRDPRP